jgi:nucleoside-diphosphate-sugar epimerase
VWVSGARGKLGAEVCRQLPAAGHEVIEADLEADGDGAVDLLDRHAVARSLRHVDPYALSKDLLERMGQMYARRGVTVTALRFHWILTRDEVRRLVDAVPDDDGARGLWGYVDLEDAARACVLSLTPRTGEVRYQALLIAASDTRVERPTEELLAQHCPDSELRTALRGTAGGFDCSRARRVIGWTPRARWRES